MIVPVRRNDSLEVVALASGSSGNATLVRSGNVALLIDAGVGPRKLAGLLGSRGVHAGDISAILVTHEHIDHISGLAAASRRNNAPVIGNSETLHACKARIQEEFECIELSAGSEMELGHLSIKSFSVPHDAANPVGYVVSTPVAAVAMITDAGSVTQPMRIALEHVNLAIVEANHDIEMLRRGPYTREMKARVEGPLGHLSNDACADLIAERLSDGGSLTVWLAHLSRINNSPSLARRSVTNRIKAGTDVPFVLDVALRDSPSATWKSDSRAGAVQLQMQF